jgi:hypothetical protein
VTCLHATGHMKINPGDGFGNFWAYSKSNKLNLIGKIMPLLPTSIGQIIKEMATAGGLNTNTNCKITHNEDGGCNESETSLAGHFLRGHGGSVSAVLTASEGAAWETDLHLQRARHTKNSFEKNYSRGIVLRHRLAFRDHRHRQTLRFEEALVL